MAVDPDEAYRFAPIEVQAGCNPLHRRQICFKGWHVNAFISLNATLKVGPAYLSSECQSSFLAVWSL